VPTSAATPDAIDDLPAPRQERPKPIDKSSSRRADVPLLHVILTGERSRTPVRLDAARGGSPGGMERAISRCRVCRE
jgi:hypothetical protein